MKLSALLLSLVVIALPTTGHAFGKKAPKPPAPPAETQAFPTRDILFGKFLPTVFTLPDGKTKVDMSVELPDLLLTQLTQSQKVLRVTDATAAATDAGEGATPARYVLKGGLTSFEANNVTNSITIGYAPGVGDIGGGVLTGAEGTLSFNVGSLEMDFHIVDTQRQEVVAVGKGSALTGGVGLTVDLNFGGIKVADDFIYRSAMTPHFQKAARDAILQMARDPNTNFLMDWSAQITNVNLTLGTLFFNSGARDQLSVGNMFTLYDNNSMRIGELRVQTVEHEQSSAVFKNDSDGKLLNSARNGDAVKIFFKSAP